MLRQLLVTVLICCGSVLLAQEGTADVCAHTDSSFRCVEYVDNYDGDTIRVNIAGVPPLLGSKISVRVRGIDTPELKGKLPCERQRAAEARQFVRSVLQSAKQIDLVDVGRDKYFRILADVVADGVLLSQALLASGLAYAYKGKAKKAVDWCAYARSKTHSVKQPVR